MPLTIRHRISVHSLYGFVNMTCVDQGLASGVELFLSALADELAE
jgi:hypothetical protein